MKVSLKNQVTQTNNSPTAFPHCTDVPNPTMHTEIFQNSSFFLFYLTISSFTSPVSYFLLICPFGAEWTMQRLSAAKLFLCRQRLERRLVTKSSSSFMLLMLPCASLGGHWGSQEPAETSRNFPEAFMGSFVSVSSVISDTMLVE